MIWFYFTETMRVDLLISIILITLSLSEAKKKKKAKKESLFSIKTLNCLVCKFLVEEIEALIFKVNKYTDSYHLTLIHQVDPHKKVETGTWRLAGDGTQEGRKTVSTH